KDTGLLGDTAAYLAAMHALLTDPTLPRKDSRSHARLRVRTLEDVLPDSLYTQDIIEELEGVITVPAGKLEDDDYVFDRDAHGLNWIVTPEAKVVAIDLKTKGLVRRSYDVSKLLEIGDYFSNDPPGDGKRLRVMERYLQEAGKMGVDMPDIREFEFRKLNADLLGALSFYAATHHRREYDGIRESYVRNAEYSARRLQTDFFEFSTAEDRKGYATWAWALDGLLELCPKCVENSCSSGSAASMSLPVG
ncbi:hypothetical protein KY362_04320, partial [Candidatus Woesearchaeota archaeon]|nr:hypothetical protein [Candidatus Woesearchaeota archaeon]